MSRSLQLLVIAGLLIPAIAEAQGRPRISIVRPRVERPFVLRNRMPAFRFELDRGRLRGQALQRWNLRLHTAPMFRGRGLTLMRNRPAPGLMRFRMGRRHLMRI
jgi:hypothetical protein